MIMEIASFEPVVGQTYDIQDMTVVLQGIFRGFIQNVRMAGVHGRKITVPSGQPLMLFEIVRRHGAPSGYRYAGAHVSTFYDTHRKRVRFTLAAEHFGNTVDQIARGGPQPRYYWKKVV
jgi:hypothetical protein